MLVIAPVSVSAPGGIRMAVAPIPVIALLTGIQPPVIAVGIARMRFKPIGVVGAILVAVPAMIIAMVGIVVTHRTASRGHRPEEGESQHERSRVLPDCFHR